VPGKPHQRFAGAWHRDRPAPMSSRGSHCVIRLVYLFMVRVLGWLVLRAGSNVVMRAGSGEPPAQASWIQVAGWSAGGGIGHR
jgi:hypothetical protein